MAVTRQKKQEQVDKLTNDLKQVGNLVVATFGKLTVAQDFELRKAVRGAGGRYQVVKNTLAERAAKGTKVEEVLKNLSGVNSIAYTTGDPVALAKALAKYAKDNPEFTFKTGLVEGRVVSIKEIESLATMPSKEEIYSKLLFLMTAPAGYGDECGRTRSGGGHQPGRGQAEVQERRSGRSLGEFCNSVIG
jgi:large subunit ribosomal protein L10